MRARSSVSQRAIPLQLYVKNYHTDSVACYSLNPKNIAVIERKHLYTNDFDSLTSEWYQAKEKQACVYRVFHERNLGATHIVGPQFEMYFIMQFKSEIESGKYKIKTEDRMDGVCHAILKADGENFSDEELQKIFKFFSQVDKPDTEANAILSQKKFIEKILLDDPAPTGKSITDLKYNADHTKAYITCDKQVSDLLGKKLKFIFGEDKVAVKNLNADDKEIRSQNQIEVSITKPSFRDYFTGNYGFIPSIIGFLKNGLNSLFGMVETKFWGNTEEDKSIIGRLYKFMGKTRESEPLRPHGSGAGPSGDTGPQVAKDSLFFSASSRAEVLSESRNPGQGAGPGGQTVVKNI